MSNLVSLLEYKRRVERVSREAQEEIELRGLWEEVDAIMERIGEIEPEPYYPIMESDVESLITSGINIGPVESSLLNAYYTLIHAGQTDKAELVMEILKMY